MALGCMEHRGGCSADNDSGDGAGIMTQVPWKLFKQEMPQLDELTTGCVLWSRCICPKLVCSPAG
jgi:glutamate synthase (ferredoxin)